jgi:hypothetical protein
MIRGRLEGFAASVVLALIAAGGCSDGNGPSGLTLDDLSDPDTNMAVVMLDRDLIEGTDTVKAGVQEMYVVQTGPAPEILTADAGLKQVTFVVSDVYATDRYLADASTFRWVGPTGRVYFPALKCAVTVRSTYVPATPSTMWLETVCLVASPDGGASFTVLVKARRFGMPEEGP